MTMKLKTLATLLALTVSAGCTTTGDSRLAWDVKPVLDVHHGMLYGMAYYQLGRFHQRQGRSSEAEQAFEKALAADPNNTDALNALGTLYAERGQLAMSVEMFRKVTELTPATAYLHNNIGYALYLQGRYTEAIESLRKAVTLDPDYERAWVNLEKAARESGMVALAEEAGRHTAPSGNTAPATQLAADSASTRIDPPEARLTMTLALGSAGALPAGVAPATALAKESTQPGPADTATLALSDQSAAGIHMTEITPKAAAAAVGHAPTVVDEARPVPVVAHVTPMRSEQPVLAGLALDDRLESARLEVANGNGVSRFATRFSGRLKAAGIGVDRITNYHSFAQGGSVIEYGPGFADAARALQERLGIAVTLKPSSAPRPGTDVRLILGRDLLDTARVRV